MDPEDLEHFKTIVAALPKLPSASTNGQNSENLHSGQDPEFLTSRARMLFGCYRRGEANDPEIYCAAIAAILGEYSREIIDYATDPRTGLPSKGDFLPTVAEVRSFCEARAAHIERMQKYSQRKTVPRPQLTERPKPHPYGLYLEECERTGANPRPIGAFEKGGYLGPSE